MIIERRHIPKTKWYKLLWFAFTFHIFDIFGKIGFAVALFRPVEWKTIPHNRVMTLDQVEGTNQASKINSTQ